MRRGENSLSLAVLDSSLREGASDCLLKEKAFSANKKRRKIPFGSSASVLT